MWYLPVIPVEARGIRSFKSSSTTQIVRVSLGYMKFVLKNGGQILSLSFIYSLAYYSLASTILKFIQSCTEYLLCIPPSVNFAWGLRDQEDKRWKLSVSYVNTFIKVFSLGNWGKMLDHWQRETFPYSGSGIFPCVWLFLPGRHHPLPHEKWYGWKIKCRLWSPTD